MVPLPSSVSAASYGILKQTEKMQRIALLQLGGRGCDGQEMGGKALEKAPLLRFLPVTCCRSNFISPCLVFSCKVAGGEGCLCSWVGKAAWFLGAAVFHSVIKKHASGF